MNINDMLSSIDNDKLRASMEKLMSDPKSNEIVEKLKSIDKDKLQSFVSSINGSAISTEAVLHQIKNNPNIIKQISNMLDQKGMNQ